MIEVEDRGRVRVLRLARPPVNALDPALLARVAGEIRDAPSADVGACVLTGSPGMFSAGLDVVHLLGLDRDGLVSALETFFDAMDALAASRLPVAAAISGHAPAGGAILALFCDWRVMAEGDFIIGLNEVQIGLPMPDVVAGLLTRTVGHRHAEELAVSGRLLTPPAAAAIGLIDEVAPAGAVVERAVAWCEGILRLPARAVAATRATTRSDLVELIRRTRSADVERLSREWEHPEAQAILRATVDRLKSRNAGR